VALRSSVFVNQRLKFQLSKMCHCPCVQKNSNLKTCSCLELSWDTNICKRTLYQANQCEHVLRSRKRCRGEFTVNVIGVFLKASGFARRYIYEDVKTVENVVLWEQCCSLLRIVMTLTDFLSGRLRMSES